MGLQDATDGDGLTPSCKALVSCFIVGHQAQAVGLGTGASPAGEKPPRSEDVGLFSFCLGLPPAPSSVQGMPTMAGGWNR